MDPTNNNPTNTGNNGDAPSDASIQNTPVQQITPNSIEDQTVLPTSYTTPSTLGAKPQILPSGNETPTVPVNQAPQQEIISQTEPAATVSTASPQFNPPITPAATSDLSSTTAMPSEGVQLPEKNVGTQTPQETLSNLTQPTPQSTVAEAAVTMPNNANSPPPNLTEPTNGVASVQTSEQLSRQIYSNICTQILREQENIIGSLALEQASMVDGLLIDGSLQQTTCKVVGDGVKVVDNLILQYQDFFGHAAVEVCKEAAAQLLAELSTAEIPNSLR